MAPALEPVVAELPDELLVDGVVSEPLGVVEPEAFPAPALLAASPAGAPEVVESPPVDPADDALLPLADEPDSGAELEEDCLDVVSLVLVVPPFDEALLEALLPEEALPAVPPEFDAPSAPISVWFPD